MAGYKDKIMLKIHNFDVMECCVPFMEHSSTLHYAVEQLDIEKVKSLIEKGADLNERNSYSDTPLHCAVKKENQELVELLLVGGACVNSINTNSDTPLHYALVRENKQVVKLLLDYGADVSIINDSQETPLHWAVFKWSTKVIDWVIAKLDNVNIESYYTPLHYAVLGGNSEAVELLIEKKADINCESFFGHTPLCLAAQLKNWGMVKLLISLSENGTRELLDKAFNTVIDQRLVDFLFKNGLYVK